MVETIEVAVVRAVSPTVRDAFPQKWKLLGLFFGAAFFFGGAYETKAIKPIHGQHEIYSEPCA